MVLYRTVFDNFVHIRRAGYFLNAAREFVKYGGTSMNIANFPDYIYTPDSHYEKLYSETVNVSRAVWKTGINTVTTIGPYPLDYFYFQSAGKDPLEYMKKGIDLAACLIINGEADAMGEVGYPHFPVDEKIYNDSGEILKYALDVCHDRNIPLILHTEDMDKNGYLRIEELIKKHYKIERVMKHHANARDISFNDSILKSVVASRNNVKSAIESKKNFLLETDYTDQKEKPGKVIPIFSVPKRAEMIKNATEIHEDFSYIYFVVIHFWLYI